MQLGAVSFSRGLLQLGAVSFSRGLLQLGDVSFSQFCYSLRQDGLLLLCE